MLSLPITSVNSRVAVMRPSGVVEASLFAGAELPVQMMRWLSCWRLDWKIQE